MQLSRGRKSDRFMVRGTSINRTTAGVWFGLEPLESRTLLSSTLPGSEELAGAVSVADVTPSPATGIAAANWIVSLGSAADVDLVTGLDFSSLGLSAAPQFESLGGSGLYRLSTNDQVSQSALTSLFEGVPSFRYLEADHKLFVDVVPDDTSFSVLYALNNTGQSSGTLDADIDAPEAWDITTGSNTIVIAVLDTGIDLTHPDLAANIWTNPGEIPGDGIDNDANGYIDDVNGYDFGYNDGTPNDVNGHGSACSGLVAAVQDNTIGVTGVAPRARIMCLKASTDAGYFYDSANIGCYLYAQQMGAKVLSCSFFSDRVSQAERDAIDYVWGHGVLPVVAAGNASTVTPYYPGAYENVLSVAATDQSNNKAGFSNYGSWVDVASPGVSLRTTNSAGGYTQGFGGTSGATPQVAGLAALIWGAKPTLTNAQVRSIIEDTATFLSWDFSNYGLVDCQAAAKVALGLMTQPMKPVAVRYMTPLIHGQTVGLGSPRPRLARLYGRGFQAPNTVRIELAGAPLQIVTQTRDWVDFMLPLGKGTLSVYVNNSLRKSFTRPANTATTWVLTEAASTGSGVVTGGFEQAINADSWFVTVTRQSDGTILLDGNFRRVTTMGNAMKLFLRRHYTGTTAGTEKVYLYDWSSASYPYGNWVQFSTLPVPQTPAISTLTINQPWKYIDPEGTVYLRIVASETTDGAVMNLDQAQLRDR